MITMTAAPAWSQHVATSKEPDKKAVNMGQVVVTAKEEKAEVLVTPVQTTIDIGSYKAIDMPLNIGDYLKDLILFDYRGESSLIPSSDTFHMRSFDSMHFVVAIDGLDMRKVGGRMNTHQVDYAYLPTFLIEKIEVLPGPHSALFPAKAIGGVVNMVTRKPRLHESEVPDMQFSGSYSSYNSQNYNIAAQGSVGQFAYDFGYQYYNTLGYLRNSESTLNTWVGRVAYVIPSGGHLSLSAGYSDQKRKLIVNNDPADPKTNYDEDYPVVTSGSSRFNASQEPSWDGMGFNFRLNYEQPLAIGDFSVVAYHSEERKNIVSYRDGAISDTSVIWINDGAKVQDKISWSPSHTTTIEVDGEWCSTGEADTSQEMRLAFWGTGMQHDWVIIPDLTLTLGLRYEGFRIRVNNSGRFKITGRDDYIVRDFGGLLPKSFLTYKLDSLAEILRDTSISLGVSRIWRAPYMCFGPPVSAWLDPEEGVGMDAIFSRRLFGNVQMKLSYFHYLINSFVAESGSHAKYEPSATNPVPAGLEYSDTRINLDGMLRQGLELELSGNILDNLSFYLGCAYQNLENQGDELVGDEAACNEPEYRIKAGLRYEVIPGTTLLLDYHFEDDQVNNYYEEISADEYVFKQVSIDAYHLFDFGVSQKLFEKWGFAQKGTLRFFVNNLFNTDYEDSRGYPATDRTFGVAFSFDM
jgi:iron complex outermembrane receptor protein